MNRNYVVGRRFEYIIMDLWRERGYEVVRSAGSHSSADLVAFRPDRKPEFVQCKVVKTETQAKGLIKKFRASVIPSLFYHQGLAIKVKGTTIPQEVTI